MMKKSLFRRELNALHIGFDPDTMKPAHIANGLFTQILGHRYKAENVNRLAVQFDKKGIIDTHKTEKLIEELDGLNSEDLDRVNKFRQHLREHLNADSAIFDNQTGVGCAYSAATGRLVTDDRHNDGYSGNFIGLLLSQDFGGGISPVVSKVREALNDESDPLSILITPFLESDGAIPFEETYYNSHELELFYSKFNDKELQQLRSCLENLSSYYPRYLSKYRFLRLLIILVSFTLLRYIVGLSEKQRDNGRVPFLIDALSETQTRMRLASRTCYLRCLVAVEEFYVEILINHLVEKIIDIHGNEPDLESVKRECQEILWSIDDLVANDEEVNFEGKTPDEYVEEVARFIAKRLAKNNFYTDFFRSVGLRCGVLMPRGPFINKHFALQPDAAEALLLGVIKPDETLTMGEYAKKLWDYYGIIIGGNVDDMTNLHKIELREVNQDDLVENYREFTRKMVTLGLAKQHSDGLVLVNPYWS